MCQAFGDACGIQSGISTRLLGFQAPARLLFTIIGLLPVYGVNPSAPRSIRPLSALAEVFLIIFLFIDKTDVA